MHYMQTTFSFIERYHVYIEYRSDKVSRVYVSDTNQQLH